ncbi:DUF896 domain-containing protein [Veillonella ratti]|uniref:DUF896 domain-containing protein n=1 Tax=Veillonella ratti TaxID=103892 RepID=UPI000F8CDF47|nr:DUF896 domain-containing protein [Veillonella ratti]
MEINDVLARINELAHKKKSGQELTEAELVEKKELYRIYLDFIRGQVISQMDRVSFVDEKGNITSAKDIAAAKQAKNTKLS